MSAESIVDQTASDAELARLQKLVTAQAQEIQRLEKARAHEYRERHGGDPHMVHPLVLVNPSGAALPEITERELKLVKLSRRLRRIPPYMQLRAAFLRVRRAIR